VVAAGAVGAKNMRRPLLGKLQDSFPLLPHVFAATRGTLIDMRRNVFIEVKVRTFLTGLGSRRKAAAKLLDNLGGQV